MVLSAKKNDTATSSLSSYGSTERCENDRIVVPGDRDRDNNNNDLTPLLPQGSSQPILAPSLSSPVKSSLFCQWYSSLTFDWFRPLLERGNAVGQLEPSDILMLPLPPSCRTKRVSCDFQRHWNNNVDSGKKNNAKIIGGSSSESSLAMALMKSFGPDFARAGALKLVHDLCIFVGPNVLHSIILFLRDPDAPLSHGLMLTVYVAVAQLTMSLCLRHYFHICYIGGLKARSAIVTAVYSKALRLSESERGKGRSSSGNGKAENTSKSKSKVKGKGKGKGKGNDNDNNNNSNDERVPSMDVINLISVDAQRVQDVTTYLHALWYAPFQITLAIYFLWQRLGPSCLGGVAVIFLAIPLTRYVAMWMGQLQKRLMASRDARNEATNEVLCNVRIVKLMVWEERFRNRVMNLRDGELKSLTQYATAGAASTVLWSAIPLFVSLATFAAYSLSGNMLDAADALTALSLFEILRFPLFMLPTVINNLVEAGVSLERVRDFLDSVEHRPVERGDLEGRGEIRIRGGTFAYDGGKYNCDRSKSSSGTVDDEQLRDAEWEIKLLRAQLNDAESELRRGEKFQIDGNGSNYGGDYANCNAITVGCSTGAIPMEDEDSDDYDFDDGSVVDEPASWEDPLALRRINLNVRKGKLIVVVGAVGSGKSTLLRAILGEVRAVSGDVCSRGRVAYFAQTPFVTNNTLRNNVLFGSDRPIDEKQYRLAISSSALEHDLSLLPDGENTEIGERGVTLSGGQKARVALARAVYHRADVCLLDDPLAAVDAHVGRDIFHGCIADGMVGRDGSSVVLVTNAIQHLSHSRVDSILVLKNGTVAERGTYSSLTEDRKSLFSSFLRVMAETGIKKDNKNNEEEERNGNETGITDISSNEIITEPCSPIKRRSSISNKSAVLPLRSVPKPLMTSELDEREKGHVTISVYHTWIKAAGGILVGVLILLSFALVEGVNILSKWWLTYWSNHARDPGESQGKFLTIYAFINIAAAICLFGRAILIVVSGIKSSRLLFSQMLDVILQAPMSFFDITPTGRIINRFSKDVYTLDENLVTSLRSYLSTLSSVISCCAVITFVTPLFTVCLIPIIVFYIYQQTYFTKTYRELKRLDSIYRSPINALLGETLDGITTIRAFGTQQSLLDRVTDMMDLQQNVYYLTVIGQCWLAVRLELVGTCIIFFACLCSILQHDNMGGNEVFASTAGFAISFALTVTQSLNWSVRMGSDLEANMVSVERIQQYCRVPSEAPHYLTSDKNVSSEWPEKGSIKFSNVTMRYRQGLPLVLKGLNISIPSRAKVGVVGRTGAGKSTLMVSLLRLVELDSGSITIDGIDIRNLGLKLLRSKIAVIPQDPTLFSGTIRSNLDQFGDYSNKRLNMVLERVGLKSTSSERSQSSNSLLTLDEEKSSHHVKGLSDLVLEGGSNFSVGQRQLLVVARALLCGAQIVIMDEATASVDADTDARIQRVIRTEFKQATCITVAHRINTILDSDYVLVMSDGQAAEFDVPETLLEKGGLFKDLVDTWEKEQGEN